MSRLAAFGPLPPDHRVPDCLAPDLRVVFCGTALGRVSAQARAYYAHPGNYFWRTLYSTGLTPRLLRPTEYRDLLAYGIGLTDLCKAHFGNDAQLPRDALDAEALHEKIVTYQPRIVAFTSKTGASAYLRMPTGSLALGLQPQSVGRTRVFVLPSPSGQARVFWNEEPWQALADAVKSDGPQAVMTRWK